MDSEELNRRLLEIAGASAKSREEETAREAARLQEEAKRERVCWLDGEECPYGKPGGQFTMRPTASCRPRTPHGAGCMRFSDIVEELDELASITLLEKLEGEVNEKVEKATTKVSKELWALADGAKDQQVKEILKLASELVEKEEDLEDREIVLLEDLEI